MNFLKKFGTVLLKVVGIAAGFEPLLAPMLPAGAAATGGVIVSDLQQISSIVATIEAAFAAVNDPSAKTGSQKLQAATPLVAQIIQQLTWFKALGKPIKDQAKFTSGVQEVTSGVADILSSLGD